MDNKTIQEKLLSLNTAYENVDIAAYTADSVKAHVKEIGEISLALMEQKEFDEDAQADLETIYNNAKIIYTDLETDFITAAEAATQMKTCVTDLTELYSAETQSGISVNFKPFNFVTSLQWMGMGMLIIMLVMAILIAGTAILNKATNAIAEAKRKRENAEDDN